MVSDLGCAHDGRPHRVESHEGAIDTAAISRHFATTARFVVVRRRHHGSRGVLAGLDFDEHCIEQPDGRDKDRAMLVGELPADRIPRDASGYPMASRVPLRWRIAAAADPATADPLRQGHVRHPKPRRRLDE